MEKRKLGVLDVSAVGLGCMGFSHAYGAATEKNEAIHMIQEAVSVGYTFSEATEDYLRRANAVCPVAAVENRYSMMARHYEPLFPVLEELGVGLVAFSPMANGLLTGNTARIPSLTRKPTTAAQCRSSPRTAMRKTVHCSTSCTKPQTAKTQHRDRFPWHG